MYGALLALFGGIFVVVTRNDSSIVPVVDVRHKVDLVASINSIDVDPTWSQDGRTTQGGAIRLSLDDLRTFTILEGTLTDSYEGVSACTDFATPNACVLLADMLGDAIVWFAIVASDAANNQEFLTLPGLVDMQDNGNEGVLRNGWIVKLATPVKRNCEINDTTSLRDFITRFPDAASTSTMNLITDTVVSVKCV